jgi:hypothetical protein
MSLWMLNISSIQILSKWNTEKWISFSMVVLSSFTGGFAIALFSKMSIDVINLSESKKAKFKLVALWTWIG